MPKKESNTFSEINRKYMIYIKDVPKMYLIYLTILLCLLTDIKCIIKQALKRFSH